MKTYQDLLAVGENENDRMDFAYQVITDHKASQLYKDAVIADQYDRQQNVTICNYQKALYNLQGKPVNDLWSANYKLASNFFKRFVTQQNQFLLGNGITWGKDETGDKLGDDFDTRVQEAGRAALVAGCAFGFWNLDKLVVFKLTEFAPLYDEENGALMAGVRFWQLDNNKPMRATLYEPDGYTDYIWEDGTGSTLKEKRSYILKTRTTQVDGTEIYDGENYPSFPIVPFWGNPHHQSELLGIRSQIDAYDIVKSGFADDLDSASVYWVLHNTGGMDDADLAQFIERLHIVHAAAVDDAAGTAVDAHTVEIPHESREKLLDRIEADLYKDYMAFNPATIASGAATATQILAAYEPINSKSDEYEYCALEFIKGILTVAGIDDKPTFTRSYIVNRQEEVQVLTMTSQYLPDDYITEKLLTVFGDGDRAEEIMGEMDAEDVERINPQEEENQQPEME
jgi:SPP1 family phage portal protein